MLATPIPPTSRPEALEKVFDRFWRADISRSRSTGGSGLGLALARELTTPHSGTLSVSSELRRPPARPGQMHQ
ncbi:ATP-binding protein [Kineosporia mesophila]|uniref:ATP-binding protein n=1 Tax=Kineosporia mesophila TaxID=566012 RepID=UPI0038B39AAE